MVEIKMSYPVKVKQAIQKRIKEGEKLEQIREETGISVPTLYNWKRELKEERISEITKEVPKQTADEVETSIKIKRLINLNRLEEAYTLTEKYPNNKIIQSQRITILVLQEKYNEAKYVCIQKENQDNALIQSQLITVLKEEENLEAAERICKKTIFKNFDSIQSQYISILKAQGNEGREKAKKICNRRIFKNSEAIQSQKIKMLIEEGKFEKAKQECQKEQFQNSVTIQSQLITILKAEGQIGEAKNIAYQRNFYDIEPIQSQLITILRRETRQGKEGKQEEAIEIATRKVFEESTIIQTQLMGILLEIGDQKSIEQAKKIGTKEIFSNVEGIQLRLARLYAKEENYEEAEKIGNKKAFLKSIPIQKLMETMRQEQQLKERKRQNSKEKFFNDKSKIVLANSSEQTNREEKISEVKRQYKMNGLKNDVFKTQEKREIIKESKPKKKNAFKENLQYFVEPIKINQEEYKKVFSKKEIEEMKKDIYIRMQSQDIQVHKKAVEQWDKMEVLLERMKKHKISFLEK